MTLTTAIQTYLTDAATSEFRGLEVAVVDHWEGRDNLLWRVEAGAHSAVLKLFLDAGQVRSRRQYDGQQLFAPLGIAPQPLWYDRYPDGLSRQIMVYRWAPGATPDPDDAGQLTELARAVATLHDGEPTAVRRFSPNPVNLDYLWRLLAGSTQQNVAWLRARGLSALADAVAQQSDAAATLVTQAQPLWQGVLPAPVHGDLRLENAVVGPGGCVLLDWEMFGLGDPAQEIAQFLELNRQTMAPAQQAQWLDTYLAGVDQPGLAARIDVYRRILAYRAVAFLLDGLRELAADAQELAAHAEDLPYFAATLTAAAAHAAVALETTDLPDAQIDALCARLT